MNEWYKSNAAVRGAVASLAIAALAASLSHFHKINHANVAPGASVQRSANNAASRAPGQTPSIVIKDMTFEWVGTVSDQDMETFKSALNTAANDWGKAEALLQEKADKGDPNFQTVLAVVYMGEANFKQSQTDSDKAFALYKAAAEKGNPTAQSQLANNYFTGFLSITKDFTESTKWYQTCADNPLNRLGECEYALSHIYEIGAGPRGRDKDAYQHYLTLSAQKGFPMGEARLGAAYYNGDFGSVDKQNGAYWTKKAAVSGEPQGQLNLAVHYLRGSISGKPEYDEFMTWAGLSADQGFVPALNEIFSFILRGSGAPEYTLDPKIANHYIVLGVAINNPLAEFEFAQEFEKGEGEEQNNVKAYVFYTLAIKNGFSFAEARRSALTPKLSPADLEMAKLYEQSLPRLKSPETALVPALKMYNATHSEVAADKLPQTLSGVVGIEFIDKQDNSSGAVIMNVTSDFPAMKAGLKAFDTVIKIDSEPLLGMKMQDVHAKVRGPVGSSVKLTYIPQGLSAEQAKEATLVRVANETAPQPTASDKVHDKIAPAAPVANTPSISRHSTAVVISKVGSDIHIDNVPAAVKAEQPAAPHSDSVKIPANSNIDEANKSGETALMRAASSCHAGAVEALIKAGADVNKAEKGNITAVMFAAANGHTDCVKALVKAGADIHAQATGAGNALMFAAWAGRTETVKYLLRAGADVDEKGAGGATALMFAARGPHPDTVRALIEGGASLKEKNRIGQTALMIAQKRGNKDVIDVLAHASQIKIDKVDPVAAWKRGSSYWRSKDYFAADIPNAIKWTRIAAEQGFANAQYDLGFLYAHQIRTKLDPVEAAKWYRKAADQNFSSAQQQLGEAYAKGSGVPQNYEEAYFWSALSSASAFEAEPMDDLSAHIIINGQVNSYAQIRKNIADGNCDELAKQLTPEQMQAVQARIKAWKPKLFDGK
jgi:TPR repeat protein